MGVPGHSQAERDRRWALARPLMAAKNVGALIACGGHECGGVAGLAPDAYFSNDRPGSVVIFCGDTDPVQLVWSPPPTHAHQQAARPDERMWIGPADVRAGADAAGIAGVLSEHGLERGPVGVLGPGNAAPWNSIQIAECAWWPEVRARLPQVKFKPVNRSFVFATVCLSGEELAVAATARRRETQRRGR